MKSNRLLGYENLPWPASELTLKQLKELEELYKKDTQQKRNKLSARLRTVAKMLSTRRPGRRASEELYIVAGELHAELNEIVRFATALRAHEDGYR